jgi:hypothetical protein
MTSKSRYWRVIFSPEGRILDVEEIVFKDSQKDWIVVEAPDIQTAKRKAYNFYCARKKKLAKARNHAAGRCACGRDQDRFHPSGVRMLTCSVCAERQKGHHDRQYEQLKRQRRGEEPLPPIQRDEEKRIASLQSRMRDRRAELRLETLLDVRKQWIASPNVGAFGKWLEREIVKARDAGSQGPL